MMSKFEEHLAVIVGIAAAIMLLSFAASLFTSASDRVITQDEMIDHMVWYCAVLSVTFIAMVAVLLVLWCVSYLLYQRFKPYLPTK